MNVITYLNEVDKRKYDLRIFNIYDISTQVFIEQIINDFNKIKTFFLEKHFENIVSEKFIDYLFCLKILKYYSTENEIKKNKIELKEIFNYFKDFINNYDISIFIRFLNGNYINFINDNKDIKGFLNLVIDFYIKYNSGIQDSFIIYICEKHPLLIFDRIEDLYNLLDKKELIENTFLIEKNVQILLENRFSNFFDILMNLYKKTKYIDLVNKLNDIVYDYSINKYKDNNIHVYQKQYIIYKVYPAFFKTKYNKTKEIENIKDLLDRESDKYLESKGQQFNPTITNDDYISIAESIDKSSDYNDFDKYMFLTHFINQKTNLWESLFETKNIKFVGLLTDDLDTNFGDTNEYFTYSRIVEGSIGVKQSVMNLKYWICDEKIPLLINHIKLVINTLIHDFDIYYQSFTKDLNYLEKCLIILKDETNESFYTYTCAMYTVSLIEKTLRIIDDRLNKESYFYKDKITLSNFLGSSDKKTIPIPFHMENILGKHFIRWLRYYLVNDSEGVGYEYRNKLMHNREIEHELTQNKILVFIWLYISILNNTIVNFINNDVLI